jgi:hypothetical protein
MAVNSSTGIEGSLFGTKFGSEQQFSPLNGILFASRDGFRRGGSGGDGEARKSFPL